MPKEIVQYYQYLALILFNVANCIGLH